MPIDPHPAAPTVQAEIDKLKLRLIVKSHTWFRIHPSSYRALHWTKHAEFRFDDPQKKFGVLYLAVAADGAFIETLGRTLGVRLLSEKFLAAKAISLIEGNNLRLVDIAHEGASTAGVDGRLCTSDYDLTRPWSRAFYDHRIKPDGILFRARHDLSSLCAAVFERASAKIVIKDTIGLMSLKGRKLLVPILKKYQYGLSSTIANRSGLRSGQGRSAPKANRR